MSLLRYCTLGALLLHVAMGAGSWGYSPGRYGPENWGVLEPQYCAGRAQSPIDLVYRTTVKRTYPAFTFTGYNTVPTDASLELFNSGHAFGVNFEPSSAYRVGGGGLPGDNYRLAQFHLHWSFLDNMGAGSEHVLNGQIYPAELHLVHWNADQHSDLMDAVGGKNTNHASLAVLGFFIELGNSDNPAFEPMLKYVAKVSHGGSPNFKLPNADRFTLDSLLPPDRTNFFRYNGSLTTPTCNEVVTWTVFKDTISMSSRQLTKFINNIYYKAEPNTAAKKMQGNVRHPQPLNGRTVYRSFDDAALNVAPRPPGQACEDYFSSSEASRYAVHDNRCYWFSPTDYRRRRKYTRARADCVARSGGRGATLALIKDADTQAFVEQYLGTIVSGPRRDYWIGLDDRAREKHFAWNDGTALEYQNWARSRRRRHPGKDCAGVMSSGKWDLYRCRQRKAYICQMPRVW
ncbi:carbonic anhydrase 1-like [Branchiostoma floridae x Branchiostoma japonicum]